MSDEVGDRRTRGWFWIANEVIDRYGKEMGAFGNAVYTALARRANANGKAWPAIPTIAETFGISERQVIRELEKLEKMKLISIEKRDGTSNSYMLLDIEEEAPRNIQAVTHSHPTSDSQSPKQESINKNHDQGAPPETQQQYDASLAVASGLLETIFGNLPSPSMAYELKEAIDHYGMEMMKNNLLYAVREKKTVPLRYAIRMAENNAAAAVGLTPEEYVEKKNAANELIQEENLRTSEDKPKMTVEQARAIEAEFAEMKRKREERGDD